MDHWTMEFPKWKNSRMHQPRCIIATIAAILLRLGIFDKSTEV